MKELIFYGSYLAFPFLAMIILCRKISKIPKYFFIILSLFFIYSRFIEPQIIITKETKINIGFETKIALISDLHIGKFKKEDFVEKIVNKINSLDIDYLVIAGDLTYYPEKKDLKKLFNPLKNINIPTYWVFGNHDLGRPGPDIRDELEKVLKELGLVLLNNEEVNLGDFKLVGLGSNWNHEDNTHILEKYSSEENIIVLTHNPDTISKYTNNNVDLTLCGHTHGGQIRIPFVYKTVIPTIGDFDKGLSQETNTLLYISSGIGETGLPMRLFNFPVIDIIKIKKD